ncbi:unnamed protein product, partial [Ixodes hexagonus]
CGIRPKATTVSARIINGTEAAQGDWPWMAALYTEKDKYRCGGTLISSEYVVTAAHCFPDMDIGFLSVRLGSTNKTNFTVDCCRQPDPGDNHDNQEREPQVVCVEVEGLCTPTQNNCSFFMRDIAVLKLKTPVNFTDNIQPICLPHHCAEPPSNATIYTVGWGRVYEYYTYDDYLAETEGRSGEERIEDSTKSKETKGQADYISFYDPQTLMQRNITLITRDECKGQLKRHVPGYTMCSTGGTCHGDSGGPLMYEEHGKWFLLGIHSAGSDECFFPDEPARHIQVSYFIDSLIYPFMKNHGKTAVTKSGVCASNESRKRCVTEFYKSFNQSVVETRTRK